MIADSVVEKCIEFIENKNNNELNNFLQNHKSNDFLEKNFKSESILYDIAIKCNNIEAFTILFEYDYDNYNCKFFNRNPEYFNPEQLKHLLNNDLIVSRNFINLLVTIKGDKAIPLLELIFLSLYEKGNESLVKYLVADVNSNDNDITTPLSIACEKGNVSLVKYLVEHGADINGHNNNTVTPLSIACEKGNESLIKYLVEHGANVNIEIINSFNSSTFYTPLIFACKNNNKSLVKYLLEHGANANERDSDNISPLGIACENENEIIIKYLVEHGANINGEYEIRSHDKKYEYIMKIKTPLITACEKGNESMVKYLIKHGASTNANYKLFKFKSFFSTYYLSNFETKSPLCIANENGNTTIKNYLSIHGAYSIYSTGNKFNLNISQKDRFSENELIKNFNVYFKKENDKERKQKIKIIQKPEKNQKLNKNKKNRKYQKTKKTQKQKRK